MGRAALASAPALAPFEVPKGGGIPLGGPWDYKAEFAVPAAKIDFSTQRG